MRPSSRARRGVRKVGALLVSVALGLAVGLVILLIWKPDRAGTGLLTILRGNPGSLLRTVAPLWLAGLSVGLAARAGLFNLGVPGQMLVGGFAALFAGLRLPLESIPLSCFIALACAVLAGGIWGWLCGLFRSAGGMDEALISLLTNFISWYGVRFLILQTLDNAQTLNVSILAALPGTAPVLSLAALAIVYGLLWHTTLGYEIRVIGLNPTASRQAGLPVRRGRMATMALAGALAGLGGALWVLWTETGLSSEAMEPLALQGVAGLSVAWLGMAHPAGILLSGLFVAHLGLGMEAWAARYRVPENLALLLPFLLYGAALFPWLRRVMGRRRTRDAAPQIPAVAAPIPSVPDPPVAEPVETDADEKTPEEEETPSTLLPPPPPAPHGATLFESEPDQAEKEGEDE